MEHLKDRVTCRNWLDTPVSTEHLKYFEQVLQLTPIKSSRIHWQIACITDKNIKEEFYKKSRRNFVGAHTITDEDHVLNPQLLAPVVYTWYSTDEDFETHPYYVACRKNGISEEQMKAEFDKDTIMGATGQSFTLMHAAEQLGYDTGFCCCFAENPLDLLGVRGKHIVSLGIGYGKDPKREYNNTEYLSVPRKEISKYLSYFI